MRISAGIAACWLLLGTAANAADEPKPAASLNELDARLAAAFRQGDVPGAEVAVVEHGRVAFVKAYGVTDTKRKTPTTDDSVFRAGSISKSVTAIAVMTLVEHKKLSLDAKLADLAPEVTFVNPWEKTDPVRLVNLIEHTTGWPDISTRVLAKDGPGWSVLKGVQFTMSEFTSRWAPGHFTVYNNAGPAVAGVIVEKASGRSFGDYLDAHVLRPMGMATADFDLTPALKPRVAKSYAREGSETPFQNIVLPPAGSLNVSAKELVQLVRFFLGRGTVDGRHILTPASVDRIERSESNLASKDGFTQAYALGNASFPQPGIAFRGHNGEIDSFTAVYSYNTRCDCGYVMMANGGGGVDFATPTSQEVEHYLTRGMTMAPPPAVHIPDEELARYAGFYRTITPPNDLLKPLVDVTGLSRVSVSNGKIAMIGLGGASEYLPIAPHLFRRPDREQASVAFTEADGHVYRLTAFNAAEKQPLWRALLIIAVLLAIVLGLAFALAMTIPWLIGAFRGRLDGRGGWLVRFAPLLSLVALFATFGMTYAVVLGSGTSALRRLAEIGPYSLAIFVLSLLYPLFALLGLWLAVRRSETPAVVRIYAGTTCAALVAFSAYAAAIGWVGARVWTM